MNALVDEMTSMIHTSTEKEKVYRLALENQALAEDYLARLEIASTPKQEVKIQQEATLKMERQIERLEETLERWKQIQN